MYLLYIESVCSLYAHLQWASNQCWGADCHKGCVTEMYSLSIILQVNQASWKELWNIFRKEMEVHHLYVSSLTLKIAFFVYLIQCVQYLVWRCVPGTNIQTS